MRHATSGERVACLLSLSGTPLQERELHALAEASLRLSSQVALRKGEGIFLEIGRSRLLFSEQGVLARLRTLGGRFLSGEFTGAVGKDAASALALARYLKWNIESGGERRSLPLESLRDFASPFEPLSDAPEFSAPELSAKVEKLISALRSLGLVTLGEFMALPAKSLASRFGREALELHARAWGGRGPAWPGFHPAERVSESVALEELELAGDLHALLFILKGLLDRMMSRLWGRGERLSLLQVSLLLEGGSHVSRPERKWEVGFPVPQSSSAGVLAALRDRLSFELAREPLEAMAREVIIEALETAPGRGGQKDFFNKKEEENEAIESLWARLSERLGSGSAFFAEIADRYLPEKSYERKAGFHPAALKRGIPLATRPARLFPAPERLEVRSGIVRRACGQSWRTLRWEGPERISGEWWEDGFQREYFRVVTEEGRHLWVYRDCVAGSEFYLHGVFD